MTSCADNLHQHSLFTLSVKLTVKNLFPWPEVKPAVRHRYHNLTPHDGALGHEGCAGRFLVEVPVGVVLVFHVPVEEVLYRQTHQPQAFRQAVANPEADDAVAHDLNADPVLPWNDDHFDDVVCAVSVDYLTQPLEIFAEVARVLKPGGRFVCTFSNRLFPTKAIRGWLVSSDTQRCGITATYFRLVDGFGEPTTETRIPPGRSDPLYAVWATAGA